ncbi:MAG TPA: transporter substrate-binding domain-containing protein [Pseudolabrys sp.]|nr:transporter substrate-binding domain-containing protein [Pseudolabrys sp.]
MRAFICAAAMLCAGAFPALAQTAPSPAALTDLAPTGRLRAAINFGNPVLAQKGPNGEPRGVSAELAAALAKRLGVPLDYVTFEAAGKVFAALAKSEIDVGFIAIEPARAAEVTFSPPYVLIEGTYLVRKDSPLKDVGDVDQPGIRIAVGLASVYDLYLTRTLKHATLVRAKVGGAAAGIPVFLEQKLDAAAGVREPLDAYAKEHPEMRVMKGAFEQIRQAMGTQKDKPAGAAYVRAFVEEMKANGFVADALKRSGQTAPVAPAGM